MTSDDLWEYVLQPQDAGKKYQEILRRRFHFSGKLLQTLKQGERVWVNGQFTFLTARGQAGERLAVALITAEEPNLSGEMLPLEILYEDDYLLAVNKPPGQVVHPNPRYPRGTLGNAVAGYWERNGTSHPFRPVFRIDRNTSGVILVAKNRFAHQQLAWQSEHGKIHKNYLGFVSGSLPEESGQWEGAIGFAPDSFIQRKVRPNGLPSLTYFRVLKHYPQVSLVEFNLATGRTHQIRVHCQASGHPLLGDDLYGGNTDLIQRQALHSFKYAFQHPVTGLHTVIRAPFPKDLQDLIRKLKANNDSLPR
ncbi:MAG: RluA family pseudouridine synthase [Desulfitobacteriaceae bacterium]